MGEERLLEDMQFFFIYLFLLQIKNYITHIFIFKNKSYYTIILHHKQEPLP
jgi:hypothetical protein